MSLGFIYLMRSERNGFYKIGFTKHTPQYREKTLQSEEPEVWLVCFAHSFSDVEKDLHRYHISKNKHIRGEWFALDLCDILRIAKLFEEFENIWSEDTKGRPETEAYKVGVLK